MEESGNVWLYGCGELFVGGIIVLATVCGLTSWWAGQWRTELEHASVLTSHARAVLLYLSLFLFSPRVFTHRLTSAGFIYRLVMGWSPANLCTSTADVISCYPVVLFILLYMNCAELLQVDSVSSCTATTRHTGPFSKEKNLLNRPKGFKSLLEHHWYLYILFFLMTK